MSKQSLVPATALVTAYQNAQTNAQNVLAALERGDTTGAKALLENSVQSYRILKENAQKEGQQVLCG